MKIYKLILSGLGADLFIHQLNEKQKAKLIEMDITAINTEVDLDELTEILDVENWDYAEESYTGTYFDTESCHIQLLDDNKIQVWISDESLISEDKVDNKLIETENILLIENSVKGAYKEFILTLEGKFDPTKLTFTLVDIHEYVQIITGIKYDGKELEEDDSGYHWTKEINFYLF